MKMLTYKALQDCRVDTFRKKGDVFEAEAFEECPPFLKVVGGGADADGDAPAPSAGNNKKQGNKAT